MDMDTLWVWVGVSTKTPMGLPTQNPTWELASNVKNAPLAVEHFYKENPSAPWKLCMAQLDFDSLFKPVPENLTICDAQFCSLESCS